MATYAMNSYGSSSLLRPENIRDIPNINNGDIVKFQASPSSVPVLLPPGEYIFKVWGGGPSGRGGYSEGTLKVTEDTKFYVHAGSSSNRWNGGGNGYSSGNGGDASSISMNSGAWSNAGVLRGRVIVAGGGGGYGGRGAGGYGGGLSGGQGENTGFGFAGSGGSQTSGGGGGTGGGFGFGGNYTNTWGGGGGGGWYGGGGTTGDGSVFDDKGAGGGSGYISGHPGCRAVSSTGSILSDSHSPTGISFTNTKMQNGVNSGHGFIEIEIIHFLLPIRDLSFSEMNIQEGQTEGDIVIEGFYDTKYLKTAGEKAACITQVGGIEYRASGTAYEKIVLPIPKSAFKLGNNIIKFSSVVDGVSFNGGHQYNVRVENRDTFVYDRDFRFDRSLPRSGKIEMYNGEGYGITGIGEGDISVSIPSAGKSNLNKITIEATPTIEGEEIALFESIAKSWDDDANYSKTKINLNTFIDTLIIRPRR